MTWWTTQPMRLIQTNLREIDAQLDPDEFIDSIQAYSGNVLLFNAGGIAANYDTKLSFHYKNPYLKNDFLGEILGRAHAAGIRLIARFDFSRLNEEIALNNPQWLYKSTQGQIVNYNGQVHTCINGLYQQEKSIEILKECASNYLIDGVFINMHGYVVEDYSYNHHGICQCDNCRLRFEQMYGHPTLPKKKDAADPIYRDYVQFQEKTVAELFYRRSAAVKGIRQEIAICNYTAEGTDIFRKESNTGIHRQLPEFNYLSSRNVKVVLGSWPGMAVSNSAVHFVDFAMRHTAVSPHFTALRLAEDLVQGGWLDYYVIGTLMNQDDRLVMDIVKDIFRYHADHEHYYSDLVSIADIALIDPYLSYMHGSEREFRGLFRMLSESHVLFDVIRDDVLNQDHILERLRRYQAVILPDVRNVSEQMRATLDAYVHQGGKLLASGASATCDEKGSPLRQVQLESLGAGRILEHRTPRQGDYFALQDQDRAVLRGFEDVNLVYLLGELLICETKPESETYLGLIDECMFGPPEKCYYTEISDVPGIIRQAYGQGRTVLMPWGIGQHYERLSNHGHAMLLEAVLRDVLDVSRSVKTTTSPLIELAAYRSRDESRELVHLVNHSGQLGTAFHAPIPIHEVSCTLTTNRKPLRVHTLRGQQDLEFTYSGEGKGEGPLSFTVPKVELFETVVLDYGRE
ncbi:alpha-amylase family protein [Paenibacillus daejeonensis]|uniref:alpha-amylase family protein n=1 Tax=Paenibacillus daejeonensis TaxID=135193 RepID=UPI00036FE20C|nr:alpha-amylase family protein [Paenibacillus daejeonensis]